MGRRSLLSEIAHLAKLLGRVLFGFYLPLVVVLTLIHFPYHTDSSAAAQRASKRSRGYYDAAYQRNDNRRLGIDYEESARQAAVVSDVEGIVRQFVEQNGLAGKRVLEVGSGRGYLQDMALDYTGLDLSASVAARYHKPFVVASATAMPFADNSFDAIWSIWVLEHIPEPERALREMRRVLKPGGVLLLGVAWNCAPWGADGFDARPYSDFNWRGKLVKASIPMRTSPYFVMSYGLPTRGIRWLHYQLRGESTRLRFGRLEPNYDIYWQSDSDAAVSLGRYETYLWFRARGDECLNCSFERSHQLELRISK
jgi:SAM-dependent methyltransferase